MTTQPEDFYKMTPQDVQRFWAMVDKTGECWTWKGTLIRGYGRFVFGTRAKGAKQFRIYAHRLSLSLALGRPIARGLVVHHECHNTPCVRPDHLAEVTQAVNVRAKHPGYVHKASLKTHCLRGHERTPENIKITTQGKRECRECRRTVYNEVRRIGRPGAP